VVDRQCSLRPPPPSASHTAPSSAVIGGSGGDQDLRDGGSHGGGGVSHQARGHVDPWGRWGPARARVDPWWRAATGARPHALGHGRGEEKMI
jgi:hypothetical protein